MILPLISGALVVIALVGLVVLWTYLDGKVRQGNKVELDEFITRLDATEHEVSSLKRRVEDLETIAANHEG